MDPKMEPKVVQNFVNFGSIFGSLFVAALELFGCLGSLLAALEALLGGPGPQKH